MSMSGKCCPLGMVCHVLLLVGGVNWGLVALENFGVAANLNIVDAIFGAGSIGAGVVYLLVALAALYMIFKCAMGKSCKA